MSEPAQDIGRYAQPLAAMARALAAGDAPAFRSALSAFDAVRDGALLTGVRKVTVELQSALQRFEIDSRLIDLAQHQVPDARLRLEHVVRLTGEAAHRTMDLVEQCGPLTAQIEQAAEALARAAAGPPAQPLARGPTQQLAQRLSTCVTTIRSRLADVRVAQGYQDLTGQIIRSVMELVDELQRALGELARIAEGGQAAAHEQTRSRSRGPVVPGVEHGEVVRGQQDVDALLADLGM